MPYYLKLYEPEDLGNSSRNIEIDPDNLTDGQTFIFDLVNNRLIPGDLSGVAQLSGIRRKGTVIASPAGTSYVFADNEQEDMLDADYMITPEDLNVTFGDKLATGFKAYSQEEGVETNFILEHM